MDNLEVSYYSGAITLHEAIAIMMHSKEPCPDWLTNLYENALMDFHSGGDFMQHMGLNRYAKGHGTEVKRIADDKNIQVAVNLKYILADLVEIGLFKNTPAKHLAENRMSNSIIEKVTKYLRVYKVREIELQISKIEHMTAYEVAGLIFGISESKVRELESKHLLS